MPTTKIDPETSNLSPVPHIDRIATALDRLRTTALTSDVATPRTGRAVRAARAVLGSTLGDALRFIRCGVALAEMLVDGGEPEAGAVFLLLELDKAARGLLAQLPGEQRRGGRRAR